MLIFATYFLYGSHQAIGDEGLDNDRHQEVFLFFFSYLYNFLRLKSKKLVLRHLHRS